MRPCIICRNVVLTEKPGLDCCHVWLTSLFCNPNFQCINRPREVLPLPTPNSLVPFVLSVVNVAECRASTTSCRDLSMAESSRCYEVFPDVQPLFPFARRHPLNLQLNTLRSKQWHLKAGRQNRRTKWAGPGSEQPAKSPLDQTSKRADRARPGQPFHAQSLLLLLPSASCRLRG